MMTPDALEDDVAATTRRFQSSYLAVPFVRLAEARKRLQAVIRHFDGGSSSPDPGCTLTTAAQRRDSALGYLTLQNVSRGSKRLNANAIKFRLLPSMVLGKREPHVTFVEMAYDKTAGSQVAPRKQCNPVTRFFEVRQRMEQNG